jgi:dTDP-4-amino-4,6-dideoxy-D-galactose acyltransferase
MPVGIELRRADAAECEAAREIAGRCMVFSRFHVDPRFGATVGDAVNRAWMQSYCEGKRGEETLVALLDGRVVGFNAILRSSVAGTPCRVVDLIGVDDDARGRGVGQGLMQRFVADTLTAGLRCMRVTTQASNIAAVNLYERSGFRLAESMLVMHRHVG